MDPKLATILLHDVKNALGILEGELSDMTVAPTSEQALQAHANCVGLREKLIGFLTLYRASSLGLAAHIEAVSPEDFLRALIANRAVGKSDLPVSIKLENMPVLGFFDEHLVGLALEAALHNATRFARTLVELACRTDGTDLVFSVRDDGPGLGTKEETPSTGLGMALCSAIGEAHRRNGRAGIASLSDHPQGGALFELRLP